MIDETYFSIKNYEKWRIVFENFEYFWIILFQRIEKTKQGALV